MMKWEKKIIDVGGSKGVLLPLELVKFLNLDFGDYIIVEDVDNKIVITKKE